MSDVRFDDWDQDMIEVVDLVKVAPDGTETTYSGVDAHANPEVQAQVSDVGSVQMTPETRTWHVRASSLPFGVKPTRGDRLVSTSEWAEGVWVIKSSRRLLYGTRYEVETQLVEVG